MASVSRDGHSIMLCQGEQGQLGRGGEGMQVARSRLGWLLVAAYLVAVVAAYFDAVAKRGTFLYDLALQLLTIPYILVVGRWLLRQPTFQVSIDDPLGLGAAVLFCSGLLLLCGAAIESGVRNALGRRRARK